MRTPKLLSYCAMAATALLSASQVFAAPPGPLDLSQQPLFYGTQQKPIVMLSLTKDHQLHFKAYTDYSDLDDDGIPELGYKHSFDYYGYWDAKKCYSYSAADGYFSPTGYSADKYCGGTGWSGNFLNWVATSRLDSVRKILYGGKRSIDETARTVLERSFLPMDAHSWAKYYNGADLNKLVPSTLIGTSVAGASGTTYAGSTPVVTATAMATAANYLIDTTVTARVGDQLLLTQAATTARRFARVTAVNGIRLTINIPNAAVGIVGTANVTSSWQVQNLSVGGLTFCNTTFVATNVSSQSADAQAAPPLIRVARGNTELWAANERWQCGFVGEKGVVSGPPNFSGNGQNGNYFPLSGLNSNAESPPNNTNYRVGDFVARVRACVNQSDANDPEAVWAKRESCRAYGANWKPIGVLQKQDGFKFGLFTGSYAKNISGGVLRSNVGDFSLELQSDGRFVMPTTGSPLATKGSIIKTLDSIRMTGYSYGDGTYIGFDGDCTFQLIDLVNSGASGNKRNQGACSSWGNPVAEMYAESLRYLAGTSANSAYTYTSAGSVDEAIGLSIATWQDPINSNNYCVPLKNIVFNAATTSYDSDQVSLSGLAGATASTVATLTNTVGSAEGITAGIVGRLGSTALTDPGFNACTTKTGVLADFRGVCPEGAPYSGSYLTAGAAYFARNNRIRSTPAVPASASSLFPDAYRVETYGVALANNTPKIDILSQDKSKVLATITPAYRLPKADGVGGGTIVDFKVIGVPDFSGNIVTGSYYINWEDSGFGGDFDQDVLGRLAFTYNRSTGDLSVTTSAYNQSTANPQGFGYVLSGTNTDGPHFHSGILGFNYTTAAGVVECNNCQVGAAPTTQIYRVTGTPSSASLKDPLYYAAKWGAIPDPGSATSTLFDRRGKKDVNGNDLPDGVPDNFFSVANPAKLADQLETLFGSVQSGSSSSSAAASTTRASSDTLAFTASFKGETWGGTIKAFKLSTSTTVTFTEEWDAALLLNSRSTARKIFTTRSDTRDGAAFAWANLSAAQRTALVNEDTQRYIAGDRSREGAGPSDFRSRAPSVMGDIINSNPAYSPERPAFAGGFGEFPGYSQFFNGFDPRQGGTRRTRAIFVGSNDGMLHAFVGDAAAKQGGTELFAYVPSMVYPALRNLTDKTYNVTGNHRYFVDGSPFVSDANLGTGGTNNWKTLLVGGLGAGGAGYFALDVTRPESFSASSVLWEFTAADAIRGTKSDLGASTSQVRFSRSKVNTETWFAVFGNGYNSLQYPTNGEAVLFAARLGKGAAAWSENSNFYRIVLGSGITDNGLSTPTLVDYDDDGFVDFVYAGDLQGNLWRVDARDADPTKWKPYRIFAGQTGQPITTEVKVTRHPNGGLSLLFGTGKYLENTDVSVTPPVQTVYSIIDLDPTAAVTTPQTVASLTQQPITIRTVTNPDGTSVTGRALRAPTDAQCTNTTGWYVNLRVGTSNLEGERVAFDPALTLGSLFVPTLVPSGDLCLGGGKSFLYSFNPFTGCASDPSQAVASESAGIQSTPRFITLSPQLQGRNDSSQGGAVIEYDKDGRQISRQRVIVLGNAEGAPVLVGGLRNLESPSGRMSWREIVD
jgi:type IV pilus assembly protein PilY1